MNLTPQQLAEIIDAAITSRLADLYTGGPCLVVSYTAEPSERADLLPLVRRPVPLASGEIVYEDIPILPNVPIMFPRAGGASITWPLLPGDVVWSLASTFSIGQWVATQKLSDAGDIRQHHPASCVGFPLTFNGSGVPVGGSILLGAPDATEPAVLGAALILWLTAIIAALPAPPVPPPPPFDSMESILSILVKVK